MTYKVLEATDERIQIWDGVARDKWRKPSTFMFLGDFSEFHEGDQVELSIRKSGKGR